MSAAPFWTSGRLDELSSTQWESLCDGCARCCLFKAVAEDGTTATLPVVCRYLDRATQRCTCYDERHVRVPDCVALTPRRIEAFSWLPDTCGYRRRAAEQPLPAWHPLRVGNGDAVPRLSEAVLSEADIHPEDLEAWIAAVAAQLGPDTVEDA